MMFGRAVVLMFFAATPALAQTVAPTPQDPKAQAQFEFMMGRRMESAGVPAGALARSIPKPRRFPPRLPVTTIARIVRPMR